VISPSQGPLPVNTQLTKKDTSVVGGIRSRDPASERLWNYDLDRVATGIAPGLAPPTDIQFITFMSN